MPQDKNKKELEIGDEVVLSFRVTQVWPESHVNLESLHDPGAYPQALVSVLASKCILQRKKPVPKTPATPITPVTPTPVSPT